MLWGTLLRCVNPDHFLLQIHIKPFEIKKSLPFSSRCGEQPIQSTSTSPHKQPATILPRPPVSRPRFRLLPLYYSLTRLINRLDSSCAGSMTLREASIPVAGSFSVSIKPTCASTEAWSQ